MAGGERERVLLFGASGFLGRNTLPFLRDRYDVDAPSRSDVDLLDRARVRSFLHDARPSVIVQSAGLVGGLGANAARPADFCFENLVMNANVIEEARRAAVRKVVTFVGGCSYPTDAPHPIPESALWRGLPQRENAPYSVAKRTVTVMLDAYRDQYGLRSAVAIPGNVYGPFDNFSREDAHVVPAMIRRFHEAKAAALPSVTCWGTGRPSRDFLFARDLAACVPFLIERYEGPEPINIARSERTTIRELAETVADVVGYDGEIHWDQSKPDGQLEKVLDVERMRQVGIECPTTLRDGLEQTYRWFVAHLDGEVRL